MNIQPADRLRLLGDMLQLQYDRDLYKTLQFILIWPMLEDAGVTDSVGLETGSWRSHCLASIKL